MTHAGQNSFTEALSAGTPMVACPGFGDQLANAQRVERLGVGRQVPRPAAAGAAEARVGGGYFVERTFWCYIQMQRIHVPRRSWALIWRGRTLIWRGLGSQIPRVLRYQELFGASGYSANINTQLRTKNTFYTRSHKT